MASPQDRAAHLTREFRRICRDISDAEARDIETLLRSGLAEERAEGFSDGRAFNPVADLPEE